GCQAYGASFHRCRNNLSPRAALRSWITDGSVVSFPLFAASLIASSLAQNCLRSQQSQAALAVPGMSHSISNTAALTSPWPSRLMAALRCSANQTPDSSCPVSKRILVVMRHLVLQPADILAFHLHIERIGDPLRFLHVDVRLDATDGPRLIAVTARELGTLDRD